MNEIEIMTGQGSHATLVVAIVTAGVTLGSITEALANGKAYDRSSHLGRGSKVERDFGHGGGWDASAYSCVRTRPATCAIKPPDELSEPRISQRRN